MRLSVIPRPEAGLWFAAAGAVLFSAKAVVAKFIYREGADALDLMALRMLLAAPVFVAVALWLGARTEGGAPLQRRDWAWIAGLGVLGYYLSSLLDFYGLMYIPAALERLILFMTPTLVLLLGTLLLKKPLSRAQLKLSLVAWIGLLLVYAENLRLGGEGLWLGAALVLGAALSYSLYLLYCGEWVQRLGSLRLVAWVMLVSTALIQLHYLALRDASDLLALPPAVWGWSLLNAVFCTVLPVFLTMAAVARIGAARTAQLSVVGPIALMIAGPLLLDEVPTALQWIGTAVTLAALGWFWPRR